MNPLQSDNTTAFKSIRVISNSIKRIFFFKPKCTTSFKIRHKCRNKTKKYLNAYLKETRQLCQQKNKFKIEEFMTTAPLFPDAIIKEEVHSNISIICYIRGY